MMRATAFGWADQILGGTLQEKLIEWRAQDPPVSLREITFRLRTDHDIAVSTETVRRWLQKLEEAA